MLLISSKKSILVVYSLTLFSDSVSEKSDHLDRLDK